jgi:glycosyltransferase involved in cell wall biosynthesis
LRVLHFITPSKVSGAELLVLRLAQAQVRHGMTTRILCKRHAGFVDRAQREGVDTRSANISGKLNLRAVSVLRAEIRRFQPDLVCTHLSSATLWGSLAARACGVPCISVVHGFNSAFCYRFAPTLICVSRAVADSMIAKRIAPDNVHVVHNGIDPQPFTSGPLADLPVPPGALCVGTVAHLSPKKGYTELMTAAQLVPDAHFVVVGEGPMRHDLEEVARGPLAGRLHLLGFRDDIPDLMRRFDIFCLPSRREPFGLVLLEAMGASCPVVAFAGGGVPEIVIHEETGLLAPPRDARALADCLRRLQSDGELRRRLGAAGKERLLSKFTLEHTISHWNSIFHEEMTRQYPAAQGVETL